MPIISIVCFKSLYLIYTSLIILNFNIKKMTNLWLLTHAFMIVVLMMASVPGVSAYHGGWHNYTDNVFDRFGSCEAKSCMQGSECCYFDEGHLMKGWFCMSMA